MFRDIFKNAYLPYKDPETLKAFLKIINEFSYDHSERLGDAFEYLLSVLGSQGDAGQFRTPRHIIDFMVEVLDPQKGEVILDPACGTAGFLISAYKHILRSNTDAKGISTLTPPERGQLAKNFKGYDISPDMVRLSLANLYLHGFTDPHVYEYDTLTSEERWNDFADVILANPPFMSPKGGIKPHKRFSIQAKRSEVLFVDYMAEHLTPNGRAAIIVPEGILFQSQGAYNDLRRMLVENSLVAVVSLPAGCFNPYSAVKTSILILDKSIARQADNIAFFKVENDGFGLGAQRRAIKKNDLPQVKAELDAYLGALRNRRSLEDLQLFCGLIVAKEKIAANGDYTLSGERYREGTVRATRYPIVQLGEVAEVVAGQSPPGESYNCEGVGAPFYQGKTEFGEMSIGAPTTWTTAPQRFAQAGDVLMSVRAPVGPVNVATQRICIGRGLAAIKPVASKLSALYAFYFLRSQEAHINGDAGAAFASINRRQIEELQIPLPPLDVQKEIVAEIEGYQKIINGARAVLGHYGPFISVHPDWPKIELRKIFKLSSGRSLTQSNMKEGPYPVYGGNGKTGTHSDHFLSEPNIVIGRVGAYCGAVHLTEPKAWVTDNGLYVTELKQEVDLRFLKQALVQLNLNQFAKVGGQPSISQATVCERLISLPPLATQQAIVAEIEVEQALVAANRELIDRFQNKIQAVLARVWGEETAAAGTDNEQAA